MNRLAVFVEGYTELVFVEKLVEEIAGKNKVVIQQQKIRGGGKGRRGVKRSSAIVKAANPVGGEKYYVLIVDCGGDELVKPRIVEEYDNLARAKYLKIIGMRDVRPKYDHSTMRDLEAKLPKFVKSKPIPVEFVLAVLEVEAWFLAEATHFPKIDPAITVAAIIAALKFDPENDDMEQRLTPTDDMQDCYAMGGKSYEKNLAQDTMDALDFNLIYLELWKKFKHLERLINSLTAFLTS